jgi:Arc-like DNA binding domain
MARKPTDTVQLKLRFYEKLRRRLEREAEENKRSMNAEIIDRLEKSFAKEDAKEERRELIEETTATTLRLAGIPVVPFGQTAPDERQVQPITPARSDQKDSQR